ncbi:membrane-bound lytic murein transglycosylase A [Cognatiyoonia sediminum]|uniref:peptidoglycan lytic exotransglycosylase n=1 Tax=Cognatiyoonia sediminum TaxID=1508389 RepID=A0A1M5QNW6_9RHOB|nr:MltA domain-containing protein [Cognatiyoonia sediminum]SHH15792.1 membrane-bound lytic murein transglycosylase A [Cognatiyoonia sediminum]
MIAKIALAATLVLTTASASMSDVTFTKRSFEDLIGWADDDHQAAVEVFLETCSDINRPEWNRLCAIALDRPNAKDFFELFFQPVEIRDENPTLFTGYFEPEISGSLERTERYRFPIYELPRDLVPGQRYATRQTIEETGLLAGKGLEIAWLEDPVDRFFLQVQGSGRIKLPDGDVLRVGFAGKNGHEYSSVGQALIARGELQAHQVSADAIRNWVRRNPEEGRRLLWVNDSYVFFREVNEVPARRGPLGAMNRSITSMRSIAVDPSINILGAPIWIEKDGENPLQRLMIAQDTGSAIKGAQRADIFYGTGLTAGIEAGRIRDGGRMIMLMPIEYALAKLGED